MQAAIAYLGTDPTAYNNTEWLKCDEGGGEERPISVEGAEVSRKTDLAFRPVIDSRCVTDIVSVKVGLLDEVCCGRITVWNQTESDTRDANTL